MKGRKDTRKVFLSWFEQYYDVFIDLSPRRFSPFRFNRFCDVAYKFNSGANALSGGDHSDNALLFVFSLPSTIDGLRRISVKMSVADVERIRRAVSMSETESSDENESGRSDGNELGGTHANENRTHANENRTHANESRTNTNESRTAEDITLSIVKKHIKHVLSLDTDLCTLEEIGSNALVLTRDGRVKVRLPPSTHP